MEDIQLIHGDCLVEMQNIPDKSCDLILCDLPYGQLNKSNKHAAWDVVIPFEPLWGQYKRIIKDNGAIVLFAQGMFTAQLMMSNPKMWRYNLIWQKGGRCSGFLNAKRQPLREHEDICVFYKKQPTYNPQMVKCLPHQRNHSRVKTVIDVSSISVTDMNGTLTNVGGLSAFPILENAATINLLNKQKSTYS